MKNICETCKGEGAITDYSGEQSAGMVECPDCDKRAIETDCGCIGVNCGICTECARLYPWRFDKRITKPNASTHYKGLDSLSELNEQDKSICTHEWPISDESTYRKCLKCGTVERDYLQRMRGVVEAETMLRKFILDCGKTSMLRELYNWKLDDLVQATKKCQPENITMEDAMRLVDYDYNGKHDKEKGAKYILNALADKYPQGFILSYGERQ